MSREREGLARTVGADEVGTSDTVGSAVDTAHRRQRPTDVIARSLPQPAAGAPGQPTHREGSHAHLWSLPDGTGLHAPHGEMVIEAGTGRLCCHLCGRWYVSLGSHVRSHGYTAVGYREAMGLCRGRSLIAADLSRSIATRQAQAYRRSPQARAQLAAGQRLARNGRLSALARAARVTTTSPERTRIHRAALNTGRVTSAARREQGLTLRLRELGSDTLAGYLRRAYPAGASLDDLARTTGLSRDRIRREIETAGLEVRGSGINTAEGRRSRARSADARAAQRVGTDDIRRWLRERRAAGWSLKRLATAVGYSTRWVRCRVTNEGPAWVASPDLSQDSGNSI